MKKKLLTVLLAVVMVFGVFGLTACGGSNKDEDYNYYGVKYSIEDEVKIEAVTFQAVYKMFTTPGKFVLYVNSGESAADYQAVNKLANDWDVTIYHFNPDLTGGYAKDLSNAVNGNICSDLTGIAAESQLKAVQDLLLSISKKDLAFWKEADGKILGISGADSTVSATGELQYKGSVAAANTIADGAKSIAAVSIKNPSYGAYTDDAKDVPYIPAAYNTDGVGTMNLFADARLHIYDDRDAITEEKTDVFVTVANYEMFAHLLDNNDGYFAVFFGGTWCPNTQAILYHVNYLAKDYGMNKVYFFDPRLDDGVRLDQVVASTAFDQNAYNKDAAAAESAATIAKNAAATAYNAAKLSADKAYDAAIIAAEAAYQKAAYVAEDAYNAVVKAAEKDAADAKAAKEAALKAYQDAQKVVDDLEALGQFAGSTSLNAEVKVALDAKNAAATAFTKASEAYAKVVADNAKALAYALDAKKDAAAAFEKVMADFAQAKTDLADAVEADEEAKADVETYKGYYEAAKDSDTADADDIAEAKAEYEEAKAIAKEKAAALKVAEDEFEALSKARKPAYDAMLKTAADYAALETSTAAAAAAALKVKNDAQTAKQAASDDYDAIVEYRSNIVTEMITRLNADDLSNVEFVDAEGNVDLEALAYVADRLLALVDAEVVAAEKAVAAEEKELAAAEKALADAQKDLAAAEKDAAELKADYDKAVAAKKKLTDKVADYTAQKTAKELEKAALEAELENVWVDDDEETGVDLKVIAKLNAKINELADDIEKLGDKIEELKAVDGEIDDAQDAIDLIYVDYEEFESAVNEAKEAVDEAKEAVDTAKADVAEKEADLAEVNAKITYVNELVAVQKAAPGYAEAEKAAKTAWENAVKAADKADAYVDSKEMHDAAYEAQKAATNGAFDAQIAAKAAAYDAKVAAYDAAEVVYAAAIADADAAFEAATKNAGNVTTYSVTENKQNITGNLNTRNNDATGAAYNYNFTYGSFLANYLPTYWSEWNITAKLTITVGSTTSEFTRMCVPNIMMFNGEKANAKAELIALAEAEYYWADTSVEGNPYRLAWESAVKEVFDANPYATYAPIVVAPEASTDSAAGGAASSAPAAGAGDSAC